jgi:cell division protein ZapD
MVELGPVMAGRVAQMLCIGLRPEYSCVPEVSANKYALNIRFTTQVGSERPKMADGDVEFELTFCNL